jgi:flavin-binding protein dodecin
MAGAPWARRPWALASSGTVRLTSGDYQTGGFLPGRRGVLMAIHKVIEVLSQSETSWEDAAQRAVKDAGKSVKNIRSIWIKNFEAVVKNNKIVEYRVNALLTFEVQ